MSSIGLLASSGDAGVRMVWIPRWRRVATAGGLRRFRRRRRDQGGPSQVDLQRRPRRRPPAARAARAGASTRFGART